MGRYIDPRTDFGFKRLFGQEDSKDILAQFLFDVLDLPHPITELSFIPAEQLPASPSERRGIYDIYCVDRVGRRFIVEMQQGFHSNLKERALYYSTFAISYQARRGADWQFELLPIYCIIVLDFVVVDEDERYLRRIQLMDADAKTVWLDSYTQVFIELAKFNRALPEATPADKWIYLLKYMPELQQIPAELANEPFTHAFAIAEEAALSPEERWLYEGSLKQARDINARLQYALETGFAEGEAKGKAEGKAESQREIARSMLARGLDPALISEITGLTATELNQLSKANV
jgi:predicted transposase/invertase (TIGR01784 family)